MKLQNEDRKFESNTTGATASFTIAASAKAFQILSDQLYTDKPRAILRELSTNALDAHIAAGKEDVPFEVQLPTIWDSTLIVKDFGIGLSPSQITSLYTTYFGSDKSHTNDFVGGLGLGSKSPFAYTDQFTVATRWNGVKYTYTAYISASGVPEIRKIRDEMTTESNGLEIHVPVKDSDISTFESTAKKVFEFFTVKPKLNMAIDFLEYDKPLMELVTPDGIRCELYKNQDNTMIMQGPIGYPVDRYAIVTGLGYSNHESEIRRKVERLLTKGWRLYAPVGTFEITASREGLSYDKGTIARILKLADDVLNEILNTARTKIQATKSLTEAIDIINNTKPYIADNSYLNRLVWNGLSYQAHENGFAADLPPDTICRTIIKKRWGRGKNPHETSILDSHVTLNHTEYRILWAEKERPYKAYLDDNPPVDKEMILYFSTPSKPKLDAWLNSLGLQASTELPKAVRGAKGTRNVNYGATKYDGYCLTTSTFLHATANDILDELNCYVLLDNNFTRWNKVIDMMTDLGLLTWPAEEIYVFQIPDHHTKVIKAIQSHSGFITPDKLLNFCIPQKQLLDLVAGEEALKDAHMYTHSKLSGLVNAIDHNKVKDKNMQAFLEEIAYVQSLQPFKYDVSAIQHMLAFLELPFDGPEYKQRVKDLQADLVSKLVAGRAKYGNILTSLRDGFQMSCSSWNFDKSPLREVLTDWVNMKLEQIENSPQSQEVA